MIPVVRCGNCGKAISVAESVLFQGKSFCNEDCKNNYLKLNA